MDYGEIPTWQSAAPEIDAVQQAVGSCVHAYAIPGPHTITVTVERTTIRAR